MGVLRRLAGNARRALGRNFEFKGGLMLGLPAQRHPSPNGLMHSPGFTEITAVTDDAALSAPFVDGRRAQGHVLYAIIEEGQVRAYGWVSGAGLEVHVLHAMTFTVPPRCIYIWDCLTSPAERNRGRFQALLRGILVVAPEAGTAYVAVDLGNTASRRALEKVGFRPLFRYYGLKLLGRPVLALAHTRGRISRAQRAFDQLGADAAGQGASEGGQ